MSKKEKEFWSNYGVWIIIFLVILVVGIVWWKWGNKMTLRNFVEYTKGINQQAPPFPPNYYRPSYPTRRPTQVTQVGYVNAQVPTAPKPTPKARRCSEERCREIFQKLFGVPFTKIRPKWLKNPVTKKPLELDGFNPDIDTPLGNGLAFEYDGEQHSRYTPYFQSCPEEFQYQVKKDELKDVVCEKRGVMLVRIPSFVAYEDLESFIVAKLRRLGVKVKGNFPMTEAIKNYELIDVK